LPGRFLLEVLGETKRNNGVLSDGLGAICLQFAEAIGQSPEGEQ
jgi:hypothetical protein